MKLSQNCGCILMNDGTWECPDCGYQTDDDLEARQHGMSGIDLLMDDLGIDD